MESLAFALAYSVAAFGAAIGAGMAANAALNAAGRNPEKISSIQGLMILAISFIDALAILGFVIAMLIKFVK